MIGIRIRNRIEELGLTQSEVARRAHVSVSQLNELLNGRYKNGGSPALLAKLIPVLETTYDYVYGRTDYSGQPPVLTPGLADLVEAARPLRPENLRALVAEAHGLRRKQDGNAQAAQTVTALAEQLLALTGGDEQAARQAMEAARRNATARLLPNGGQTVSTPSDPTRSTKRKPNPSTDPA